MTLRALIIDDEKNNRENLNQLLTKYCPQVSIIGLAGSVDEAYQLIQKEDPDLIFLDIKMPEKNGFELLEMLPKINFEVIVVTAYDQYAIKAIKYCALDYLLKPINYLELIQAVNNASKSIHNKKENLQLKMLVENLRTQNKPDKIALPSFDKVDFYKIEEIVRCESENNYTHFYLKSLSKITISKTLKEIEELLAFHDFIRVHQSHLINKNHIMSFLKHDGGYFVMADKSEIPISRNRKQEILKLLNLK